MEVNGVPVNPGDGNPSEGSPGGSAGAVGVSGSPVIDWQSKLDALEVRRATFQGQYDKAQARVTSLEAQVSESEDLKQQIANLEAKLSGITVPSVSEIAASVAATIRGGQSLDRFRQDAGTRYVGVDMNAIAGDTPEEIEANAKAEFDRSKGAKDAAREEALALVRGEYEAKYGKLDDGNGDPADQGDSGIPGGKDLSVNDFLSLSDTAKDALSDDVFDSMMMKVAERGGDGWSQLATAVRK